MITKLTKSTIYILFFCALHVYVYAQIKPTSAEERLKSFERKKELANAAIFKTSFKNIGPAAMSGRVVDIEVNPNDATEFYVAYATGGLWHTVTNGLSFTPIFDSENAIGLGDVAVHWPSRTIWVGTGEANSSRSSYSGIGVYKSTNNGKTWEYLGLPETHHIGEIIVHPTNPNIAWVAALGHLYSPNKERGVYKTTDGGKTWNHTLYIDDNTGAIEMDIDPKDPNVLYTAMWYKTRSAWDFVESGNTSGIYKSTDGGNNWQLITGGKSGFPQTNGTGRIGVVVSYTNPKVVYAVLDNQDHQADTSKKKLDTSKYVIRDFEKLDKAAFKALNSNKLDSFLKKNGMTPKYTAAKVKELVATDKVKPSAIFDYLFDANEALFNTPVIGCEIYRSENAGKTWKKVNKKQLDNLYSTYGYYFGRIFISPSNDNKIVVVGVSIDLSTDGGKTFTTIGKNNTHSDHHSCWINPKKENHFIIGNDGGVNITYDNGDHWFKANTPAVGQFYAITTDNAKPYRVYGGLQDNGVWVGNTVKQRVGDGSNYDTLAYKAIGGGDGMQVQVDTRDNRTVYSGSQFGVYSRSHVDTGRGISIYPRNELGEEAFRFNWQTPIVLSKHNQDVLYYATNKFHRSLTKGADLQVLSGDLTNGKKEGDVPFGTTSTIAESPLKFGLLYLGTDDGNLQVSKDGGYTWTNINIKDPAVPKGLYVTRVTPSGTKEGRVYATLNGLRNDHFAPYLFVSNDYGNNWKQLGANLPQESINVIREDPKSDSILYVGTDGGLYVSIDAGNNWMAWTKGIPYSIPVHDIAIQQRENELVLGTHGRSLYIATLKDIQALKGIITKDDKKAALKKRASSDDDDDDLNETIL